MRTVVFAVSYGRGMGTGSLMREATLASAAKRMGYRTVLLAQKVADEGLPEKLSERVRNSFDEWISPAGTFAVAKELAGIKDVVAVIVDDYRQAGKRPKAIAALKALGGVFAIMDGLDALEFEEADRIISLELGVTDRVRSFQNRLLHGADFSLVSREFFDKNPLPLPLPPGKTCFFYMGSTDHFNIIPQALDAIVGLGYAPVVLASKKSPFAPRIAEALRKHSSHLWLDTNLTTGQLNTIYGSVSVAIMAPVANATRYALHNRCPIIALTKDPTVWTNAEAVREMGLPVVMLDKAKVEANYGKDAEVLFPEIKTELPRALKALEITGYIDNRLPNRPPFDICLTDTGPENILRALGLERVACL